MARSARRSADTSFRKRKLCEEVAEAITAEIRGRRLKAGASLGTEAELIARYGVSRATVLEAVRQLEKHGAVLMKRGGHGGLMVSDSRAGAMARVLSTFLELSNVSLAELLHARTVLELLAAELAATRAHEGKIKALRETADATGPSDYLDLSRLGLRLTRGVAEAAGNSILIGFMRCVIRTVSDNFQMENRPRRALNPTMMAYADNLRVYIDAIGAGDASLAQHYLRTRINLTDPLTQERFARLTAAGSPLVVAAKMRRGSAAEKAGEMLAFMLRDDIVSAGWSVGSRLGSESELATRYRTSRWILRQAIRILEPHAIVTMRRGQGGGLFVGEPNPDYTVEIAVRQLRDEAISPAIALEILGPLLTEAAKAPVDGGSVGGTLGSTADEDPRDFYRRLLELTNNRAMILFGRVLLDYLAALGWSPPPDGGAQIRDIAAAFHAGDASLAERRLRRHFGGLIAA